MLCYCPNLQCQLCLLRAGAGLSLSWSRKRERQAGMGRSSYHPGIYFPSPRGEKRSASNHVTPQTYGGARKPPQRSGGNQIHNLPTSEKLTQPGKCTRQWYREKSHWYFPIGKGGTANFPMATNGEQTALLVSHQILRLQPKEPEPS